MTESLASVFRKSLHWLVFSQGGAACFSGQVQTFFKRLKYSFHCKMSSQVLCARPTLHVYVLPNEARAINGRKRTLRTEMYCTRLTSNKWGFYFQTFAKEKETLSLSLFRNLMVRWKARQTGWAESSQRVCVFSGNKCIILAQLILYFWWISSASTCSFGMVYRTFLKLPILEKKPTKLYLHLKPKPKCHVVNDFSPYFPTHLFSSSWNLLFLALFLYLGGGYFIENVFQFVIIR